MAGVGFGALPSARGMAPTMAGVGFGALSSATGTRKASTSRFRANFVHTKGVHASST